MTPRMDQETGHFWMGWGKAGGFGSDVNLVPSAVRAATFPQISRRLPMVPWFTRRDFLPGGGRSC